MHVDTATRKMLRKPADRFKKAIIGVRTLIVKMANAR